jgi:hypothetical protein
MRKLVVLLVSVIGLQGFASPVMASSPVIPATGSLFVEGDPATFEFVQQGQQCLIQFEEVITYTGTLEGTSDTLGPVEIRFFATCEEVFATEGVGIPSNFSAVEHFVGTGGIAEGKEATFRTVGRTDAEGNFEGTIALRGDLHGRLKLATSGPSGTYEGVVVVRD